MKKPNYLFFFFLDDPLETTADYQRQTIRILHQEHGFSCVLFHAYMPTIKIADMYNTRFWLNFATHLQSCSKQKTYHFKRFQLIPFDRFKFIYELNTSISYLAAAVIPFLILRPEKLVLWTFHIRFQPFLELISNLFKSKKISLYDCQDYVDSSNRTENVQLRIAELKLLKQADYVFSNNSVLIEKFSSIRNNIHLVPIGFRHSDFKKHDDFSINFKQGKPQILYIGGINSRLDLKLINYLAKNNPDWLFTFIGPVQNVKTKKSKGFKLNLNLFFKNKNINYIPYTKSTELPKYILKSHVGIIPYDSSIPLNYYCHPLKLYEYFYFGLPTVSTMIPALKNISSPLLKTTNDPRVFDQYILDFIKKPASTIDKEKLRNIARSNSWDKKIEKVVKLITAHR